MQYKTLYYGNRYLCVFNLRKEITFLDLARDLCSLKSTLNRFNEHISPGDLSLHPTILIGT